MKRAPRHPSWALMGNLLSRPYWTGLGVLAAIVIGIITIWVTATLSSTGSDSVQQPNPLPPSAGDDNFDAISEEPYLLVTALVSNSEETMWRTDANADVGDYVFLYMDVSNYGEETARNVRLMARPFGEAQFLYRPTFVASATNAEPGVAMGMIYVDDDSKFTLEAVGDLRVTGDLDGDRAIDMQASFPELDQFFGETGFVMGDLSRGERPGWISVNFTARVIEVE